MSQSPTQKISLESYANNSGRVEARSVDVRPNLFHISVLLVGFIALTFSLTHMNVVGSVVDPSRFQNKFIPIDKLFHFCAYFGLMFLVLVVFASKSCKSLGVRKSLKRLTILAAVVFCYGAFDEISQPYVGRCCELMDLVADIVGIVCAQACFIGLSSLGVFELFIRRNV